MNKWKPNNFLGYWSYDPRYEIRVRAQAALKQHDTHFTISVELAMALAELRECDATTVSTGDEDGPMPPITIRCKKMKGHTDEYHHNGYSSWK